MRAGALRHRVSIIKIADVLNRLNEPELVKLPRQVIRLSDEFVQGSLPVGSPITGSITGAEGELYGVCNNELYVLCGTSTKFVAGELLEEEPTGAVIESVDDVQLTVWAQVQTIKASEHEAASKMYGEVTHEVVMRKRDDITMKDQLIYNGRTLEVNGVVDNDNRGIMLEIYCTELNNGAG